MNEIEDLMDEHEYARKRKTSLRSIQDERYRGIGCPYVKIGRSVRYRPSDVAAYIESNLVVPSNASNAPEKVG